MPFLYLMLLWLLPLHALAQDAALYDAEPSAEMAFIRIVQADPSTQNVTFTLEGQISETARYPSVSAFYTVPNGTYNASHNGNSYSISLVAGHYYTLALFNVQTNPTHQLFEDTKPTNPAKSQISFYNLSDQPSASLKAPEHNATIFENIAPHQSTSRMINAVTLTVQTTHHQENIAAPIADLHLKRGANSSIFLLGERGTYHTLVQQEDIVR